MTTRELWETLLRRVSRRVTPEEVDTFLRPLEPASPAEGVLLLEAPSREVASVVEQQFLEPLEQELTELVGRRVALEVRWASSPQRELFPTIAKPNVPSTTAGKRGGAGHDTGLLPSYTFERFVQGSSNQFAHAAALAVARQPGSQYNPLFLYGPTGCGKTHLLHAIGNYVRTENPDWAVRYVTADTFMTELVAALRKQRVSAFKQRYRRLDLLLVDDVQTLAKRERTQEEFFHLFNTLYDQRKQIVLAGTEPPHKISGLDERLVNRFQWGLLADLQLPDLETRSAILQRKAEEEGIPLPTDVAMYLANAGTGSVRELHGYLVRVAALASLRQRPLDRTLVAEVLSSAHPTNRPAITIERIQQVVAEFFGIRPAELRSKRRTRSLVVARQIAMYLCRQHLLASFPSIGEHFGHRDHTTAMHAVQTIARRRQEEAFIRDAVERIERLLLGLGTTV